MLNVTGYVKWEKFQEARGISFDYYYNVTKDAHFHDENRIEIQQFA
jgi:hypothetical protein